MSRKDSTGPLAGLKVIEMGSFIAGPFCGQLLADFGADVVKLEPPGTGDAMRQWGVAKRDGKSLWWPVIARNKQSVTVDLRQPEGRELARRLIADADVLVENFRPGTLEDWGLDPDRLKAENPGLIVTRVSGFGQTGPYSRRAGFGSVAEAMAGMRGLAGFPDRPPPRVGLSIGDSLAGIFAAMGVLLALRARDATTERRGQVVDVAITESVLAVLESVVSEFSGTGAVRGRTGSILPGVAPSNLYPTADGTWILIGANADGIFRRLTEAMGQPELGADERYATHSGRGKHQDELDGRIAAWTVLYDLDHLVSLLEGHGVPAGPVNDAAAVVTDPHFRARDAIISVETPEFGTLAMQGVAPQLSETPGRVSWAGPTLGQHTDEVLGERLGLGAADLADLRQRRII
ncbi:MAG TPA: CoA transferase [Aliidongia sp.]|uniref:CaiB/BaiF CoA transferase family protein n=1 Tax=Aliidongia sp. TaxID=1914230 RepID=UPI002DDD9A3A|nr:CoA transferase [Aliidongia sp.]HEV2675826.1 CoA transferase [Aliidongia sp.]